MSVPRDSTKAKVVEEFTAWGHRSIRATHRSTFEITKDPRLTRRGDCIVAIASEKGARDLSDEMKGVLKKGSSRLTIILQAGGEKELVKAQGCPQLTLSSLGDLVARKSGFVCGRTLAVKADKAALDFSRTFVNKLKNPQQKITITLIAE